MARKAQAHWSEADTNVLIDFLVLQLPTVVDGTGFKPTVWTEAATKVNALAKAWGSDKTGPSCKNKFARHDKDWLYYIMSCTQSTASICLKIRQSICYWTGSYFFFWLRLFLRSRDSRNRADDWYWLMYIDGRQPVSQGSLGVVEGRKQSRHGKKKTMQEFKEIFASMRNLRMCCRFTKILLWVTNLQV